MEYEKGYVYELMEKGGPTYVTEPYFMEAAQEMMRARTLCAKANACMPDDPTYVTYLEELFGSAMPLVAHLSRGISPQPLPYAQRQVVHLHTLAERHQLRFLGGLGLVARILPRVGVQRRAGRVRPVSFHSAPRRP